MSEAILSCRGERSALSLFDAFGHLVSSTGTFKGPYGFARAHGDQEDGASRLQLLGHRYYDASTGRFLTRDPVKDGRNWYGYCAGNPSRHLDPEGLVPDSDYFETWKKIKEEGKWPGWPEPAAEFPTKSEFAAETAVDAVIDGIAGATETEGGGAVRGVGNTLAGGTVTATKGIYAVGGYALRIKDVLV